MLGFQDSLILKRKFYLQNRHPLLALLSVREPLLITGYGGLDDATSGEGK